MASKATEGASVIAGLRQVWPDFELINYNEKMPTSDIAIQFYERFICGQLQIEISMLQQTLINNSSCPESYMDILNVYALYTCTQTIIKKLGLIELLQTFGLTDLLSPTRRKFKMFLILLSNCVLYATGLQEIMDEIKTRILQTMQNSKDIEKEIDDFKDKLNSAVISHTKNIQKIEDWQKIKKVLITQKQSKQIKLEDIKEAFKLKNHELNVVQDEYETLDLKLNNILITKEKLEAKIVDDHQTILNEKERLIIEKNELDSDEYINIMNYKMQAISCYHDNLSYINHFLENIPLLLEKYEIFSKYNNETEKLQNETISLEEIERVNLTVLEHAQNKYDSLQKKIDVYTAQTDVQIADFDQEIADLKYEIQQEKEKQNISLEMNEKIVEKIENLNKCSYQYEQNQKKQDYYYDQKYKEILELKGVLDNKVMTQINLLQHELKSKKN